MLGSRCAARSRACYPAPSTPVPSTAHRGGEGFPTARFRGARVRGTDLDGREVLLEDEGGVLARALQHEVDHLDGKLYIDRLSPALRREARDAITARGWRDRGRLSWDPSRLSQEDV